MNPFLLSQSPVFDEAYESSIATTPNQCSFIDSTSTQAFLEDENEEPSFAMNEVEERLNNPVNFTAEKEPQNRPTPNEIRLMRQERCSQFFQNRTPTPSSQLSQPLLLEPPSTDSGTRRRTLSMAEQFAMFVPDDDSSPCLTSCTPIKRVNTEKSSLRTIKRFNTPDRTPRKTSEVHTSPEKVQTNALTTKASPQIPRSSPVLSSPIFNCTQGLGSPILDCFSGKPRCPVSPIEHSDKITSSVRQRLQWTYSPEMNKHRSRRQFCSKQQIIKRTKTVSG